MQKDEINFDYDNDRVIWRKIFVSGVLEGCLSPHYWVIDALDECSNAASFIDGMLAKINKSTPLRVLVVSRETSELRKQFLTLDTQQFQSEKISTADTLSDIEVLVKLRASFLAVESDEDRTALVDKMLQKSNGSFLWTSLVLSELSNAHSRDETNQILEDIPREMESLYNRALDSMTQSARAIQPAKAILTWATASVRPLKLNELEEALKLDINSTFPRLWESIMALCGQLVMVDRFGKVQMIHETAREFLLSQHLESEFAINEVQAHTRIAKACLMYLTGEEMRPPRTGRRSRAITQRSPFSTYACAAFSHHLAKADPSSNDILLLVDKFLRSNILSWIESVSGTQNLLPLIRAAKDLRIYHNSCVTVRSPLARSLHTIKGWATDLIRIAAKFADALIISPSAIYSLVLPFCPEESAAFKTVKPGKRLSVVGVPNAQWDDRLACIDFSRGQATAVCHGDEFFAVGLSTGAVILYHSTTCQEFKTLGHGEAVKHLQFQSKSDCLASCGLRMVRVWNIHNEQPAYSFQAPSRPIGLAFHKSTMIIACDKNYLASWNLDDGTGLPNRQWDDCAQINPQPLRVPSAISISIGHQMLAVAYTGRPILLWDLEEDTYYGSCGKKLPDGRPSTHAITALVFNPGPSIGVIAASYLDGELVLIDPFDDQVLASSRANCHTLAASPDGRFLAGGAGFGTIHIYEFDTLRLLYRVQSSNVFIKQLVFSKDGFHFMDIRASQCNVWEPAALVRDLVSDASSESVSTSISEAPPTDSKVKVTSMDLHQQGNFVFCGKNDGSVSLYDLRTGIHVRTLYLHKSHVRIVVFLPQSAIIMSVDASNGVFGWELTEAQEGLVAERICFQSRLDCGSTVTQVLAGEGPGKFVLSTKDSDHLWTMDGRQEKSRAHSHAIGDRHWIQHPRSLAHMICFEGEAARVYDWDSWSEVVSVSFSPDVSGLHLRTVIGSTMDKSHLLLGFSRANDSHNCIFSLFYAGMLSIDSKLGKQAITETLDGNQTGSSVLPTTAEISADASIASAPTSLTSDFGQRMSHIIGLSNDRLVFLDTSSWVCSVDIDSLLRGPESYTRHFFVPYEWFAGKRDVIGAVVQRDVLLVRNDEVAIIKAGLEFAEEASI